MSQSLLKTEIRLETDVVSVRRKAREIASVLGFDSQDQTRIATAVSEIARNAFEYAGGGVVEFKVVQENFLSYNISIQDKGPGISKLSEIENGTYVSPQGMGLGLMGAKKLMDHVVIETSEKGTSITMKKVIPRRTHPLTHEEIKKINDLLQSFGQSPMAEVQKQNHEILLALSDLNDKKDELTRMNQELEDTNRGVVALYAELDEKAEILRLANESKTSFLSDMTHEFRSPLNSILGIAQILLMEAKEDKASEREKQVNFIVKAARGLSDLVNDLLDIAKIEAGKISVRPTDFNVNDVMSSLRGLMRPIGGNENVTLHFDMKSDLTLHTDEGKLTQILRNLISNALKYTLEGEIHVRTSDVEDGILTVCIEDTGIGIPEDMLESIFEEFFQVDHEHQGHSKGTGLGLPLSRKLARLLGGTLSVESTVGKGSNFHLKIPVNFSGPSESEYSLPIVQKTENLKPVSKTKVLVIDDDESFRYQVQMLLKKLGVDAREAVNGREGLQVAKVYLPDLIILDLVMPEKDGMEFIRESMEIKSLRDVPIILHSSKDLESEERLYLEQVTRGIIPKQDGNLSMLEVVVRKMIGK